MQSNGEAVMRVFLACLVLPPCLVTASGCGTFGNTFIPCGGGTRPHVYGGVENDLRMLESGWDPYETEEEKSAALRPLTRGAYAVLSTLLVAADLPLSIVGDTITLPWILATNGYHGW